MGPLAAQLDALQAQQRAQVLRVVLRIASAVHVTRFFGRDGLLAPDLRFHPAAP